MKTGGNMEPLGARRRRFNADGTEQAPTPEADRDRSERSSSRKRSRSPRSRSRRRSRSRDRSMKTEAHSPAPQPEAAAVTATPPSTRKRKSRWGNEKAFVPGMPTMLPSNISEEQQQQYLLQLKIEDCSRKLRTGDLGIPSDPSQRSPSPEPVYDSHGKRLNTREVRTRQKVEQMRHQAIQEMCKVNPIYKPPPDYKPPSIRLHDKVWIPQEQHPDINFVGLLIGPRGNTLKALEKDTNTKIIIRGKGSVKESKIARPDRMPMPGEDEPLHAYITAQDEDAIKGCVEKVNALIADAIATPDNYSEMRKVQLRELAMLNGTFRAEDVLGGPRCANCGQNTHKTWECTESANVTQNVICTMCGAAGHIARDCKNQGPGGYFPGAAGPDNPLDEEYSAFMNELGESPAPGSTGMRMPPDGSGYGRGRGRGSNNNSRDRDSGMTPIIRVNLAGPRPPYGGRGGPPRGPPTSMSGGGGYGYGGPPVSAGYGMPPTSAGYGPPPTSYGGYGGYDSGYGGGGNYGGWGGPPPPPPQGHHQHQQSPKPGPVPPPKGNPDGGPMLAPPPPPPNMDLSSLLAPPPPPE